MELRDVLAALRAAWWLPVIGLLTGGAIAFGASQLQTPLYTSETQLFVSTRDATSTSDVFQGSQFSQERVSSYARLIAGEEVAARVVDALDLSVSPAELADQITATAVADTVLIDVEVTDASPELTAAIAAAVGDTFIEFVDELETPDGEEFSLVEVTVTDRPEVPAAPSSPNTSRNTALGLLVGLLIGAGLAILRARLDRSVKDPEETAELTGAPVIGSVLRNAALDKAHTIDRVGDGRTVEDYRQLRTNLQFLNVDQPPKVIMVSSALPAEGKTTLVINLALALSDAGQRVVVVEADLRRPKVTRYLGLVGGVGLTNVLAGTADVEDIAQRYRENLSVVAAGPTPPNPGELLGSRQMASLLDKLRADHDFVLVDAPPLLPVADSTGLAVHMDGVVLSVRYGSTRKDQVQQAAATLERVGASLLGVVLNIVPPKAALASAYGYGYGYGYDPDRTPGKHRQVPPPDGQAPADGQ
ncbi:capsular exopolysaccharide family [Blastococcus sp. DSM 46786]|uniref:polysaccharide biosynthesis tyrosine autokinase n=1 Tax=Blastococcus sp. DSM 46786 TaxID=1798227 RepID=UPI0008AEE799|nr:polysaccharide biosynthesis tyrosine autokinase [Blastococcus sp. DSM 46786]SEL64324.1 capsular exopolysaccharide family [Blastococcus sp. DSM 46786]